MSHVEVAYTPAGWQIYATSSPRAQVDTSVLPGLQARATGWRQHMARMNWRRKQDAGDRPHHQQRDFRLRLRFARARNFAPRCNSYFAIRAPRTWPNLILLPLVHYTIRNSRDKIYASISHMSQNAANLHWLPSHNNITPEQLSWAHLGKYKLCKRNIVGGCWMMASCKGLIMMKEVQFVFFPTYNSLWIDLAPGF